MVEWYEPYHTVLDKSTAPFFKWFVGGKTNIVHNALDRHVKSAHKNKLAIIWEGEDGEQRVYSYFKLWKEVNRFANVLKSMGVKKGDTVTIYMGRVPELPIAMLATVKIGAIHSVVYGGFSEQALADRITDAKSKVVVTCDGAWLRGKTVNLKEITDEAVNRSPIVQKVIVYKRTGQEVNMHSGRDFWWHELMALPIAGPKCETEVMDAEDPLFILYTSGTTGKPKGLLHTCGGYQVHIATTLKYVFDLKEEDRYWCAADPGLDHWPLLHRLRAADPGRHLLHVRRRAGLPLPDRWWQLIEKYSISILYTAPTAIRAFMRFGEDWTERHDLSSLRLLGSVGEPINPEAWRWYYKYIGHERCPIMDTWWQTETGGFMITPTPVVPLKPGTGTLPFAGMQIDVVRENGESADANEEGYLVIKQPWPGMARTIWGDPDRYRMTYWSEFADAGLVFHRRQRAAGPGRLFLDHRAHGRRDQGFGLSPGHRRNRERAGEPPGRGRGGRHRRAGRTEGERDLCLLHPQCRGDGSDALEKELKEHVRHEVGPIAIPAEIEFVTSLPKTRSGKIMRRLLKAQAMGQPMGDTSTLGGVKLQRNPISPIPDRQGGERSPP